MAVVLCEATMRIFLCTVVVGAPIRLVIRFAVSSPAGLAVCAAGGEFGCLQHGRPFLQPGGAARSAWG
nr:MAG: hypothetical protein DIU80_19440 [Chloroflexota bacterium]